MSKYVVSDIFEGTFPVSQNYGNNPDYYKQFGFAGHEGVDFATPTGTPIVAPFDGIIVRDIDDARVNAYGIHIVVWDPIQKCAVWFCHLESNSVSNGDKVTKGKVIGLSNNTGNTSGPHLHVNFCETDATGNRINLDNGYKGFLNIMDLNLIEWKLGQGTPISVPSNNTVITDQTKYDFGTTSDGYVFGIMELQAAKSIIQDEWKRLNELERRIIEKDTLLTSVRGIILGSGWPWTKISKLKTLLPK